MTKRGKVLRNPSAGPGLLMAEGQQYQFVRQFVWKSEVAPSPGLVVDVDLDANGKVQAIRVVPDSQLAKERAEAAELARHQSETLLPSLIERAGTSRLVAGGTLVGTWFFLAALSIERPSLGDMEFTFWQLLGFLNAGDLRELLERREAPGAGMYGLLALLAAASPFLHLFWKDKRAILGGFLPMLFMVLVGIAVRGGLQSALGGPGVSSAEPARHATGEAMKAVSLGLGAYVSFLVSLSFAIAAVKGFWGSKTTEAPALKATHRKAA